MKERHQAYSPDGLPVRPGSFTSYEAAEKFLAEWCERYRRQGYYKTAECERIPVDELRHRCSIITL